MKERVLSQDYLIGIDKLELINNEFPLLINNEFLRAFYFLLATLMSTYIFARFQSWFIFFEIVN